MFVVSRLGDILVGPKPVSIPHQYALELRAAANQLDELVSFLVESRHNSAAHDAHPQQAYAYGRSAHYTPLNARDQCVHVRFSPPDRT